MRSRSSVKKNAQVTMYEFMSLRSITCFVLLTCCLMVLLFPRQQLLQTANTTQTPTPISLYYLGQLTQQYPHDDIIRIALIKQQIGNASWDEANAQLKILQKNTRAVLIVRWLTYQLLLTRGYHLALNDAQRTPYLSAAKSMAVDLIVQPLTLEQRGQLATDLLGFELPDKALQVYLSIMKLQPIKDPQLLAQVAKVALYASQYKVSGEYYFMAAQQVNTRELQRGYILAGLSAYQAGSLFADGFAQVSKLPSGLLNDKVVLDFLVNYALAANRADLAQDYIKHLLFLSPTKTITK